MKIFLRRYVLGLICATIGLSSQGQETERKASSSVATPKPDPPRKKKKVVDGEDSAPKAKPAKPSSASMSDPTINEKAPHAPAATIVVSQLACST